LNSNQRESQSFALQENKAECSMKRQLAEWMVCPANGDTLTLQVDQELDEEILEGELVSASGRRYAITRGVPRMLPADLIDAGQIQTGEDFSAKWQRATDFGHEEKSRSFYVNWYLERYKFGTTEQLAEFLNSKTRILDAGTGVGRDTRLYADNSQGVVFGVDFSLAIDSAYKHLQSYSNVHLIQADLTQLPFPAGFFDFIACDQVLHHTPNTEESFHKLASRLASGGDLSIYVYRKKAPLREFADDYLRDVAANMTEEQVWELSEQLTELGRVLSEVNAAVTVPDIPALGVKAGTYDVQRFIYWHMLKCYWNASLTVPDNVLTNFDWYKPHYAHRHTAAEVRGWFTDEGLEIITFDECDAGISVRGHKR
jgi:SAM-dependent methyltransferase